MAVPATYSRQQLRAVLTNWHADNVSEHPAPFPGPLAAGADLTIWLEDVRRRCVDHLNLHQWHWPNAVLSWIPSAQNGGTGIKEQLLDAMNEKRSKQELINSRFWGWNDFKQTLVNLCFSAKAKRYATVGAATLGSAIAIPALGVATLGVIGFTASGIAGGSLAAAIQSAVYGGATGGIFSILQGIGAGAALPVAVNVVAGAIGGGVVAGATAAQADPGAGQGGIDIGDIGDEL